MAEAASDVPVAGSAGLTAGQGACLILYVSSFLLWAYAELTHMFESRPRFSPLRTSLRSLQTHDQRVTSVVDQDERKPLTGVSVVDSAGASSGTAKDAPAVAPAPPTLELPSSKELLDNGLTKCLCFDRDAIKASRATLRNIVEFGTILLWWYCVDRTQLLGSVAKEVRLAYLWITFGLLTVVAAVTSIRQAKVPVLLNRTQTEEWKGWMQVLFLLYHYFNTWQLYNAIRIFIAAYVWMTGFGNFAYYYKTNDFSLPRFFQMMWRLNFLVVFACIVLRNSYTLYYICPMHTLFTLMVYGVLAVGRSHNKTDSAMWLKMASSVVIVYVCWEIKPVFDTIWAPFQWLLAYTDPRRPDVDPMHEWYFRSGLDRYIWIFGMVCAFVHPHWEAAIKMMEELPTGKRAAAKGTMLAVSVGVGYWWYSQIFCLPKLEYNALHPYTSWIPITVFIVLRNFTPRLRSHAVTLYGWLGCITLETYIGQFHTWLKTEVPDGQPKLLLELVPGSFIANFVVCTALYVLLSYRLFHLTNDLKSAALPSKCNRLLLRNCILMAIASVCLYVGGHLLSTAI